MCDSGDRSAMDVGLLIWKADNTTDKALSATHIRNHLPVLTSFLFIIISQSPPNCIWEMICLNIESNFYMLILFMINLSYMIIFWYYLFFIVINYYINIISVKINKWSKIYHITKINYNHDTIKFSLNI